MPAEAAEEEPPQFDPAPIAAQIHATQIHAALDRYLRDRAPDQRLAFWKAVALGYGGVFEDLAGSSTRPHAMASL